MACQKNNCAGMEVGSCKGVGWVREGGGGGVRAEQAHGGREAAREGRGGASSSKHDGK